MFIVVRRIVEGQCEPPARAPRGGAASNVLIVYNGLRIQYSLVRKSSSPTSVLTWSIMATTLCIQPPIHQHWPHTSPLMCVVHCIASVHVMMIGMLRKTIVPLMRHTRQTIKLETVAKSDNISLEKTEAVDQFPGWIALAMCGSYDKSMPGIRSCWYIEVTCICVRR